MKNFISLILSILLLVNLVSYAEEVRGVVTAVSSREAQVTIDNISDYKIKRGDKVEFKLIMDGLEFEAGKGTVTGVKHGVILVRVIQGSPDIDMQAFMDLPALKPSKNESSNSQVTLQQNEDLAPSARVLTEEENQQTQEKPQKIVHQQAQLTAIPVQRSTSPQVTKSKMRLETKTKPEPSPVSNLNSIENKQPRVTSNSRRQYVQKPNNKLDKPYIPPPIPYKNCVYKEYQTGFGEHLRKPGFIDYVLANPSQPFSNGVTGYLYMTGLTPDGKRDPVKGRHKLLTVKPDEILSHDKFNIALSFHIGDGIMMNTLKAATLYKKLAAKQAWLSPVAKVEAFPQDLPYVYHNLGCLYLNGRGLEKNETYAKNLFTQAAKHNFSPSVKILELLTIKQEKM